MEVAIHGQEVGDPPVPYRALGCGYGGRKALETLPCLGAATWPRHGLVFGFLS